MSELSNSIPGVRPATDAEKREFEAFSMSRWVRDFLKIDLCVSVCGFTVFEYHYPPKKEMP